MKILKWIGIILISLIIIACGVAFFMIKKADALLNKRYTVEPVAVVLPNDSASLAHGKLLASGCYECHGDKLEGKDFFNDPNIGTIYTPNITSGKGSAVAKFTDKDWVRAVRNGVAPDGRGLFVMPAQDFHHMSEADLGAVIAYVKRVPPVDKDPGKTDLKWMGKLLIGIGAFGNVIPAEEIDQKAGFAESHPSPGITTEYGKYLVDISGCRSCHGKELNGFKGGDPKSPPSPNLTPGGVLANWSQEDFIKIFRTGSTPEGITLNNKFMPWKAIGNYPDEYLTSIYLYLKSLPKMTDGYKKK